MMPTALSAQVGGAVNAGGAVRGAVVRGIPGPDLGTCVKKFTVPASVVRPPATKQHR